MGPRPILAAAAVALCWIQLSLPAAAGAGSLRFCATSRRLTKKNELLLQTCSDLKQKSNTFSCVIAEDRLSCLRMLVDGLADFTIMEPEDLSITNLLFFSSLNSKLLVTHELKMFAESQKQFDLEMIALVKNNYDQTWLSKDKKLCYLGLEQGNDPNYQYYYTNYFERMMVVKECNDKRNFLENRIADLSNHFESACIAGPWSLDSTIDGQLKSKYKNLCALCGSPAGCYEVDRFYGMQGAISCLLDNVGDIAWVSRSTAEPYFEELSSYGFNLLCPEGLFIPLSVNKSCSWIVEPRSTIIARNDIIDLVVKYVKDDGKDDKGIMAAIHASNRFSYLSTVSPPITADEFIRRYNGFTAAKLLGPACRGEKVRWCVASNPEAKKCEWMQSAARVMDVEPRISCIQQPSRQAALDAVADNRCDVFVAKPDEELIARTLNLTPVAHIISNKDPEANRFAAIVRKDAKYKSFKDLQGKNACFTGYKSVGWNAFFSILRNSSSSWSCRDELAVSQFFNESCVQGLSSRNGSMPRNLYSLCRRSSASDPGLSPEENTVRCLMNGGDVAFLNVSAAKKYNSGFSIFRTNYKFLCQNESSSDQEPCYLAETTLGSVLVNKNISKTRQEDIYLMLLSLDRLFGRMSDRETAMFNLYGPFDGQPDVIFPDKTQHLHKHVSDTKHGTSYEEILANLQEKVDCSSGGSWALTSSRILLLVVLALVAYAS